MAKKDPAFLFYSQDFITGTMFMNDECVGKYIRLLCVQHQHGGSIPSDVFESITAGFPIVSGKFEKGDNGYFNIRLMNEMMTRNKKSANISASTKAMWERRKDAIPMQSHSNPIAIPMQSHKIASKIDAIPMPPEDEGEDEIGNVCIKDEESTERNKKPSWNSRFHEFLTAGPATWLNYETMAFLEWKKVPYNDPTVTVEDCIASAMAFRLRVEADKTDGRYITRPNNFLASGAYRTNWAEAGKSTVKTDSPVYLPGEEPF
jgi:uncharacterized protein YdaU (DUF1376 family)